MKKKINQIKMPEMFSKAGRFTQEKYIVFQRQKELSSDSHNQQNRQTMDFQQDKIKLKQQFQTTQQNAQSNQLQKKLEHKNQLKQPFKKMISRDQAQQLKMLKNPPPPCGHYHPKFNEIDNNIHYKNIFYDVKKSETRKIQEDLGNYEIEKTVIPEKSLNKVLGRVIFPHFTSRKKYWCPVDPHQNRFEIIPDTFYHSKLQRPSLGREDFEHLYKKNSCPDYNKNYDMILKKTILMVPDLQSQTSRINKDIQSDCFNENFFNYGQYTPRNNSQVFKKIKEINMQNQLSRYTNSKSHFPSFMQKNMTNRQSLNVINQKMLETNYFADSKFQTVYTSFKTQENLLTNMESDIDKTLQSLYSIQ